MSYVPGGDADAIHDNIAGKIAAVAEKGTPADADLVLIEDSAASNAKKKVQISNLGTGDSVTIIAESFSDEEQHDLPDASKGIAYLGYVRPDNTAYYGYCIFIWGADGTPRILQQSGQVSNNTVDGYFNIWDSGTWRRC